MSEMIQTPFDSGGFPNPPSSSSLFREDMTGICCVRDHRRTLAKTAEETVRSHAEAGLPMEIAVRLVPVGKFRQRTNH